MKVDLRAKFVIDEPMILALKGVRVQNKPLRAFQNVMKALHWAINAYREVREWISGAEDEIKDCQEKPTALVRFESSRGTVLIMYHHGTECDHVHVIASDVNYQAAQQIASEFINQCLTRGCAKKV